YLHEGARSMAIEALEKAIQIQPVFPEAHFLLAECLLDQARLDKARDEVNIAIAQGTPLPSGYRLLARIHLAKDEFDAAILALKTAIRLSQSDTDDATDLRVEIEQLLEFVEKLKVFARMDLDQNSPDVARPVALNAPQPYYTEEARRLKIQGAVLLGILVTENGDVDSVLVLRKLGHGL